ncbi:MerR family transcriptional regulator [Actinoplanes siamensis]|uniref:HTH merR-type domain-containing protein n=1 Tax=Actinoplanes siamensis TaxID=1223317 RepID=A0A919TM63_9ACTN|nr:helix-turn-helix domain-containing protein [Actinoplanes siamensis]GIF06745.1 hypothetical protein Asi03nite_42830 [Actinoplanes siamensis]
MLSISEFARITRLSPRALRLYDKFGLLRPAAVDESSGYRSYAEGQLDRARLIAWLRRLGMPLARIAQVCDLPPDEAAGAVARYWAQIEAETAARGRLAGFLVDHLSGRAAARVTLGLRCAASARPGPVRDTNDDYAYAGSRLLAVADGMRGLGDRVGRAAVGALRPLETLAGDRYLLCTDGLSTVVPAGELREALSVPGAPRQVVEDLIQRAYAYRAPDNVAVVVADVVALDEPAGS